MDPLMDLMMESLRVYCLKVQVDEGIKLGLYDGKAIGTILIIVYGITLGIDVGTELGYLDGSFDGSNDSRLEVLLLVDLLGYHTKA